MCWPFYDSSDQRYLVQTNTTFKTSGSMALPRLGQRRLQQHYELLRHIAYTERHYLDFIPLLRASDDTRT